MEMHAEVLLDIGSGTPIERAAMVLSDVLGSEFEPSNGGEWRLLATRVAFDNGSRSIWQHPEVSEAVDTANRAWMDPPFAGVKDLEPSLLEVEAAKALRELSLEVAVTRLALSLAAERVAGLNPEGDESPFSLVESFTRHARFVLKQVDGYEDDQVTVIRQALLAPFNDLSPEQLASHGIV